MRFLLLMVLGCAALAWDLQGATARRDLQVCTVFPCPESLAPPSPPLPPSPWEGCPEEEPVVVPTDCDDGCNGWCDECCGGGRNGVSGACDCGCDTSCDTSCDSYEVRTAERAHLAHTTRDRAVFRVRAVHFRGGGG